MQNLEKLVEKRFSALSLHLKEVKFALRDHNNGPVLPNDRKYPNRRMSVPTEIAHRGLKGHFFSLELRLDCAHACEKGR